MDAEREVPRRKAWRPNARLVALLGLGALVLGGELVLRFWDEQQRLEAELRSLRGRTSVLEASNDGVDWTARTRVLQQQQQQMQARLWHSPTQAQAQARLRDWLSNALRSAEVARGGVTLLPVQASSPSDPNVTQSQSPSASASSSNPSGRSIRVRATVTFDLAPQSLERALLQIEGGGQLAQVDALSTSSNGRRVEMTVSVPVVLTAQDGS